jgi:hypothetical protein
MHFYEKVGKILQTYYTVAAQIENLTIHLLTRGCHEKGSYSVIHISKVPQLTAFPDFKGLVF